MTKYEQILREVSEACGEEILPASDRVAELVVEDTVVLVKPADATEESVSIFTVVLDGDAGENILRKAMELNLFARGTDGGVIGLFVDSLVYSRDLPLEGVSAEAFGQVLASFARKSREISAALSGDGETAESHKSSLPGAAILV
jgi:hypothetical protein